MATTEDLTFVATHLPDSEEPFNPDVAKKFQELLVEHATEYIQIRAENDNPATLLDFAAYLPYRIGIRDGAGG